MDANFLGQCPGIFCNNLIGNIISMPLIQNFDAVSCVMQFMLPQTMPIAFFSMIILFFLHIMQLGNTALTLATANNHEDVAEVLQRAGTH